MVTCAQVTPFFLRKKRAGGERRLWAATPHPSQQAATASPQGEAFFALFFRNIRNAAVCCLPLGGAGNERVPSGHHAEGVSEWKRGAKRGFGTAVPKTTIERPGEGGPRSGSDEVLAYGTHTFACCANKRPAPLWPKGAPAVSKCIGTNRSPKGGGFRFPPLPPLGIPYPP